MTISPKDIAEARRKLIALDDTINGVGTDDYGVVQWAIEWGDRLLTELETLDTKQTSRTRTR